MKFFTKWLCLGLFLTVIIVGLAVLFPELAHAADAEETQETVTQTIASMLTVVMQFLNMLLWPFLIIIGDLMDTDLILGPGMEERLLAIWVQVRNLVNVAFVLVLLVVAFYNVLGLGGGEGELAIKTALPKIILGLVLVNFTFLGGKILLDLVNVATTAAFALPQVTEEETGFDIQEVARDFEEKVCSKDIDSETGIVYFYTEADEEDDLPIYTRLFCEIAEDGDFAGSYQLTSAIKSKYFESLNANNIGLVMTVNMGALSALELLKDEGIKDFADLSISVMFAVLMYLVFATTYLVLGIVLLTRLVVLWIALALSPIAVLIYVVPQVKEWAGGGGDITQKVIKTLIAPIIIGFTMSLGYLMISAWDVLEESSLEASSFSVNKVISTEFLISGIDDLPQFIIALASIIIVWTGVFAATNDTYASFATEAIKGFGNRVRDAALKAPLLLTTLAIGTKGGVPQRYSLMDIKGLADTGLRAIEYSSGNEAKMQELAEKLGMGGLLKIGGTKASGDPTIGAKRIHDALDTKTSQGRINGAQLADVAREIASVVMVNTPKERGLIEQLTRIQEDYEKGDLEDVGSLRGIINDHYEKLDEAFEKAPGQLKEIQRKVNEIHSVDRAVPGGGPPAPEVPTPRRSTDIIISPAQQTTFNASLQTLSGAPTAPNVVAALTAFNPIQTSVSNSGDTSATAYVTALNGALSAVATAIGAANPNNLQAAKNAITTLRQTGYDNAAENATALETAVNAIPPAAVPAAPAAPAGPAAPAAPGGPP